MELKLKTPAEIKTGRMVSEVKQATHIAIQTLSFDARLNRVDVVLAVQTKEGIVLETRKASFLIEEKKSQIGNFLRSIYEEIKQMPGFDGDLEAQ